MSQDNVDIVRRWVTAMNGELASMEAAVAEWFEEDSDYYPVRKFPEARPAHGREEFAHWLRRFYEGFPEKRWDTRGAVPGRRRPCPGLDEPEGGRTREHSRPLGRPLHVLLGAPGALLSCGGPPDLERRSPGVRARGRNPRNLGAIGARRSRRLLSLRDTARTVSQENVELADRLADAFNRRDLNAYLALTDEDVEAFPRVGAMEGGYHRPRRNP